MQYVDILSNWLSLNPHYGLWISFIMAFAESMLFIGGIIPGSLAITAIGTLAGAGILPIYPTLISAILGAIAGDFASFITGRFLKEKLKDFFIFKKYPKTLQYGEFYFKKHGAKSVFFARFIGPIRAIVPAIAGMLGMKIHQFILANVLSACGWSVLFYFPGVLIGRGHDKIHQNLTQIASSVLIWILLPIIIVKLGYQFRYKIYPFFCSKINQLWGKMLVKYPILEQITPSLSPDEYHKIGSECLFFLLLIFLTLVSPFLTIRYHAPWLEFPLLHHFTNEFTKNAFNLFEILSLLIVMTFLCLKHAQAKLIICFSMLSTLLIPLVLFDSIHFALVLTISVQYLLLRIASHHQMHHYQFFYIVFVMFWNLASYLATIQLNQNMYTNLVFGISLAQGFWLFLRKNPIELKEPTVWVNLVIFLPIFWSVLGMLF